MSDPEQLYEHVLVLRCRAGDETAFAELIGRYQPKLLYYLRQFLKKSVSAEDILQEVWFDVFRNFSHLENICCFAPWVYKIARRRAIREWRKPAPPEQCLDLDSVMDDASGDLHLSAENAEQIHAALSQLDAEHREVLVLRFLEEMSYDDIASVIGCPVGTVGSRIHHAKRALRTWLERTTCYE